MAEAAPKLHAGPFSNQPLDTDMIQAQLGTGNMGASRTDVVPMLKDLTAYCGRSWSGGERVYAVF